MTVGHYNRLQIDRLREIGTQLRQERLDQGLSLEEVAGQTRIQARLLRALEEGEGDQLPEPVYVQGFIRKYADLLGLNGNHLGVQLEPPVPQVPPRSAWAVGSAAQLRPVHLYLVYLVLVIGAVSGLSYLMRPAPRPPLSTPKSKPAVVSPSPTGTPTAEKPSPAAESPVSPSPSPSLPPPSPVQASPTAPPPASPLAGLTAAIDLQAQTWVLVIGDDQILFEGILDKGIQKSWSVQRELVLRAGNAGVVQVAINGRPAAPLGPLGQVREVVLTPASPQLPPP